MSMSFRNILFRCAYLLKRPLVIQRYEEFRANAERSREELEQQQVEALRQLLDHCSQSVPFYRNLFAKYGLKSADFTSLSSLNRLPILSKQQIRNDPASFTCLNTSRRIVKGSTGGSTGDPLKYLMSEECYCRGAALLMRGWGFAGYTPGDKMAVLAGASLVSNRKSIKDKAMDYLLNTKRISSYGMGERELQFCVNHLLKKKPSYLRGYASSLYILAQYMLDSNCSPFESIKAIFSTAEILGGKERACIERAFNAKVFDTYGLNDGGVSAYECHLHDGMHIDYERSLLEVVDEDGKRVFGRVGRIVATSLYNYVMPFVRYDTGDLGVEDSTVCACGNVRSKLRQLCGRTTDSLILNGKNVGSPVLTVLMGKVDVQQYQIHQTGSNSVTIKYVNPSEMRQNDRNLIVTSLKAHVGDIDISFAKVDQQAMQSKNKHKFIINNSDVQYPETPELYS
jgi:phenylacetate-CoA ligase